MGSTPHWVVLILAALATYRLTRFITRDAFPLVSGPREWIQERWDPFDDEGWDNYYRYDGEERAMLIAGLKQRGIPRPNVMRKSIAYLVTCAWCVSIWVSAGVTVFMVLVPPHPVTWFWVPLVWLSSSAV